LTLFLGWKLKVACTEHQWDGFQYRHSCYNDIYALYFFRDLQPSSTGAHPARFPYIDSTAESRMQQRDVEYPVGTGLFIGAVAQRTSTPTAYFNATAVGLAIAAIVAIWATALTAADQSRVLYVALAPTILLYAFLNWDLLAVATTALAFLALKRKRNVAAGVALGVGASTKLYPGFLLPVFLIAVWRRRRDPSQRGVGAFLRQTRGLLAGAIVSAAVMNVPILIANPRGWWYPWSFQSDRFPNFETLGYMIYRHLGRYASQTFWFDPHRYPRYLNLATGGAFVLLAAWLLAAEMRRERFRAANAAFGVLALWLLTAKVFSPQYMLWLLPFFALIEIPWYGYVAFVVTDLGVWAAIASYLLALQYQGALAPARLNYLEVAVFVRYAVLGWLLWMSRRSAEQLDEAPVEVPARAGAGAALASEA